MFRVVRVQNPNHNEPSAAMCIVKPTIKICMYVLTYYTLLLTYTLFQKKRFLVNLQTERNASKFAMFMEKENPCSFFRF